ncbi:hypothetical protein NESM_000775700 [Novymonas esmeraldas]|uniref:Uncharacterized protein n=1 Tax=Novymonas esmeraldas TaxID=1808958 RepID=A0AAW0EVA3_9TRYP
MCRLGACCRATYYLVLAVICIYLAVCVLIVPHYRFVALMILALVVLYGVSAWRFLPSEQFALREMAEEMARQRCSAGAAAAVAAPPTNHPTAAAVVTPRSAPSHEPYRG